MKRSNSLKILGLSKKEEKVLIALQEGLTVPALISIEAKVSRPTVYDVLNKFKKRGIVYSTIAQRKKTWHLISDEEFNILLNDTKRSILSYKKNHEEIYHTQDSKISFYLGKESLKKKFFEIFSSHKSERWIGLQGEDDLEGWSLITNEEETKKLNTMIKDNKLIVHGVLSDGWVDFAFKKLGKEWAKGYGGRAANIHYLDKKYFNHAGQVWIFKDVIYLLSLNKKILVEIKEEEIARSIAGLVHFAIDSTRTVDVNKRVRELLEKNELHN